MSTTVKITNDTAGVTLGESTDDLVTAVQRALHAVVGVDAMDTDADPVRLLALLGTYWSRPEAAVGPADQGLDDTRVDRNQAGTYAPADADPVRIRSGSGEPMLRVLPAEAIGEAHQRGAHARGPAALAKAIADLFHMVADDQALTDEVLREVMHREPAVALRHPGLVSSDDEGLLNYRGTNYVRQSELRTAERDNATLRNALVNAERNVQEERTARTRAATKAAERMLGVQSQRDTAQRVQEELHRELVAEREARTGAEASLEGLLRERAAADPRQLHLALGQLLATADQAEVEQALQLVSARHVGLLGALRGLAVKHVEAAREVVNEQTAGAGGGVLTQYAEGVRRGTVDLWA